MAVAYSTPDAPAFPVNRVREATLVAASIAVLGSRSGAQRALLPFGLKAGHHAVRARIPGPNGLILWTPRDSEGFPVVVIAGGHAAALDSVLPVYLASHGFRVALAPGASAEAATRVFGDSTPIAVVQWGRDTAATAILEGPSPVSIRVVRPGDAPYGRLRVVLPPLSTRPGAEARHYRLLFALTQAVLNATLASSHPTLLELAARLRAAGLQGTYIRAS